MKVFLSWSGQLSKLVAEEFSIFLGVVIQAAKPWMSKSDIPSGSQWFSEIMSALSDSTTGVLFVTQENKTKPWLLFEAGAIARGLAESRVCTVLVDCTHSDIAPPLSNFQHETLEKDRILHLLATINDGLPETGRLKPETLQRSMDAHWGAFKSKVDEILATTTQTEKPRRNDSDLLVEILETVRGLDKQVQQTAELGKMFESSALLSALGENLRARETLNDTLRRRLGGNSGDVESEHYMTLLKHYSAPQQNSFWKRASSDEDDGGNSRG